MVSANSVVSLFLARALAPELCKLIWRFSSRPLLLGQWLPNMVTWMTRYLKRPWRDRSVWQCPLPLPIPVSREATVACFPQDPVLSKNMHNFNWRERRCTLTEERGSAPPVPHAWMAPVVEDMLSHSRTGFTKVVVTDPGRAVLFYGRWSLGEGLSLGKARHTTFTLTGYWYLGW